MRISVSRWTLVILMILALLVSAAGVWAAPSSPSDDAKSDAWRKGLNADKVDGHHAVSGYANESFRRYKLIWTGMFGQFNWRVMPKKWLDNRYLNDNRKDKIQANVDGRLLEVNNTSSSYGASALYARGGYAAVMGKPLNPVGFGVYGSSTSGTGAQGASVSGVGVRAYSESGVGLEVRSRSGTLIEAYDTDPWNRKFYVSHSGDVWADGVFFSSGADIAEMLPATEGLEAGDVLVIGSDGILARSTSSNASNIAGVYSTKPGFVGGFPDDDEITVTARTGFDDSGDIPFDDVNITAKEPVTIDDIEGKVPLAILGVVPVKVSAENGAIQPGDLVTTSSTPGHAMKAGQVEINRISFYLPGTILGKALETLEEGTGVISVLVTLQ